MKLQNNLFRRLCAISLVLALAGCSAIPKVDEAPPLPPQSTPPPPPPPVAATSTLAWDQRPFDQGAWRYDPRARSASFVQNGASLLSITCQGAAIQMSSNRFGAAAQPLTVDLKTSSGNGQLIFTPQGSSGHAVSLQSRDNKLDQIAFSRGRFALDASNGRGLTLPVHAEIGRVIEDCRG